MDDTAQPQPEVKERPKSRPLTKTQIALEVILVAMVFSVGGYFVYVRFVLITNAVNGFDSYNQAHGCTVYPVDYIVNITYSYSLNPVHWGNMSRQFNETWKCPINGTTFNVNSVIVNGLP